MTLIEQLDAALERHDNGFGDAKCYEFLADNADTLRAALRDAARYRWLRDHGNREHWNFGREPLVVTGADDRPFCGDRLDAAIDKAIESESGNGGRGG